MREYTIEDWQAFQAGEEPPPGDVIPLTADELEQDEKGGQ